MDWSDGHYERIGPAVLAAAERVVDAASPMRGETVVDLGCGDGNAALLATTRGARVIGIDPATRLLEVAAVRATERSLDATFLEGVAEAMPLADAAADAIVSVFGVIFAPDVHAAAAEIARVARPTSRVVLSAWRPQGAIADVARLRSQAVGRMKGALTSGQAPFAWHDPSALRELFEPYSFAVSVSDAPLPFVASSAAAYAATEFRDHPGWVEAARLLDTTTLETLQAEALRVFAAANEDPSGFRVTSEYVIATMKRG
jgi:SAM-dependent methyltransferase